MVCRIGENPVIGIALDAKPLEEVGTVKTLCFVGLNAMSIHGNNYKELFHRNMEFQRRSGTVRPAASCSSFFFVMSGSCAV